MRESSRPSLADRLIWGTVALGFFGPFEMMKRDNGLFVPSSEWVLLSTLAYVATLLVLSGAVVALHWHLIERSRDRMSKQRVMFSRIAAAGVLCLLPIWTIGLVHGVYRSILMVAPQDRASMPVQFDHVSVHQYPGHKTYKAVVRLPGTRRSLSIEVGPIAATERPARGELVPAYGFRNWLGLTIDGIALRERASADAQ